MVLSQLCYFHLSLHPNSSSYTPTWPITLSCPPYCLPLGFKPPVTHSLPHHYSGLMDWFSVSDTVSDFLASLLPRSSPSVLSLTTTFPSDCTTCLSALREIKTLIWTPAVCRTACGSVPYPLVSAVILQTNNMLWQSSKTWFLPTLFVWKHEHSSIIAPLWHNMHCNVHLLCNRSGILCAGNNT